MYRNVFTHLLHGSHFLHYQLNVLVGLVFCVLVILVVLTLAAARQVRLDEDPLRAADVAAAVWAGVARRLLLDKYRWQVMGRAVET